MTDETTPTIIELDVMLDLVLERAQVVVSQRNDLLAAAEKLLAAIARKNHKAPVEMMSAVIQMKLAVAAAKDDK